ncbi:unnamed protein product [Boreogadus saida]
MGLQHVQFRVQGLGSTLLSQGARVLQPSLVASCWAALGLSSGCLLAFQNGSSSYDTKQRGSPFRQRQQDVDNMPIRSPPPPPAPLIPGRARPRTSRGHCGAQRDLVLEELKPETVTVKDEGPCGGHGTVPRKPSAKAEPSQGGSGGLEPRPL